MWQGILQSVGGVGLFLLGMELMTDALKLLSGGALRRTLIRFTRSPLSGALTGATTTALIQSSSATTVTAVGFVSAGLMRFEQAVGIIIGANVGTTITGWLAALLGFKLQLGLVAQPLLLLGVLLRMFGGGRREKLGLALAGFALLFIGISALQAGMAGLQGALTPERLPGDDWSGRFYLVLIGMAITVITQSSSSGVAAALAAVHADTISLPQAAAMVLGMDVGTTATAMLATVSGGTEAKRTGFAHVFYNVLTGVLAFVCLGPISIWLAEPAALAEPEIALVAFHTLYNVLGAMIMLPMARPFARLVVRMWPNHEPGFAAPLDAALLREPPLAIAALLAAIQRLARAATGKVAEVLEGGRPEQAPSWNLLWNAALRQRDHAGQITPADPGSQLRHQSCLHALDHLKRLCERAEEPELLAVALADPQLHAQALQLAEAIRKSAPNEPGRHLALQGMAERFDKASENYRAHVIEQVTLGKHTAEHALQLLDAHRLLGRLAYHAHRLDSHLGEDVEAAAVAGRG